ncbi:MAG TPA: hypothetical protein VGN37_19600 [Actinocatenispora sp.]
MLDGASRALRDLRSRISAKDWSGPGADAYRGHYESLVRQIDDFYERMSKLIDLSGDTGTALAGAISEIPLPDMADIHGLGMHGIHISDAQSGNQVQYHFFRTHRDRYDDGGFLDYVGKKIDSEYPDQTGRDGTIANPKAAKVYRAAADWYQDGTRRARAAFSTLLTAYAEQHAAIPSYDERRDTAPRVSADADAGGGASGDAGYAEAGPSMGAPPPPKTGAGYGTAGFATHGDAGRGSHAPAVDPSQWSSPPGTSLSGSGHPGAVDAGPRVDAGIGGAGVGGAGAGGGAGGFGTAGSGGSSYGSVPRGYGAAAADPIERGRSTALPAGRGGTAEPASNTYGGMPTGGGGKQDREERQTWLIEDDDVWSVPLGPPPVIE